MRSDDLVPVLKPDTGPSVGFRQGVIVTWNPANAENTVLVGRSLMTNLPILNTSEAAILAEGDVVGIMTAGQTWGILGRFTIPGSEGAVSALSALGTQSANVATLQGTTSDSFVDLATVGPSITATVGASGRLLVIVSCEMEFEVASGLAVNTSGGYMSFALSGANTLTATEGNSVHGNLRYDSAQAGGFDTSILGRVGGSRVSLLTDLNPGATTITAKYRRRTSGTASFQNRNITAMSI